jgi:hypothetical protein
VAVKDGAKDKAAAAAATTPRERWRQQRQEAEAAATSRPARGPPSNSVWRPATHEQQLQSLKGVVEQLEVAAAAAGVAAASAAAAAPAAGFTSSSPADALAAAIAVGSDATLWLDDEESIEEESFAAATTAEASAPTTTTPPEEEEQQQQRRLAWSSIDDKPSSSSTPRASPRLRARTPPELGVRSANAPRSPRLLTSSAKAAAAAKAADAKAATPSTPTPTSTSHGRALQQFGGGALPPTTTASHASPVKVGACGLAELTGGSALSSPAASGAGLFGWAIAVNKGADVMVIGQPAVSIDPGDYANGVLTYDEDDDGAAFVFAAVPGGGSAVPLHFAKSCSFADQRLVNPIWRVDKEVVGFGTEVAVSFKGNTALVAGRLIPNPPNNDDDDDGQNPPNWAPYGTDMVWAFQKGVTGYLQFSRQEMPLINPPVGEEQFADESLLRRVVALGLSFDGGLAMAAYLTVDEGDPNYFQMSEQGGSVQIFGSTKERFLLTQVIEPPKGSRTQSWSVAAAMSADSQTIIASDGSGDGTLLSDGDLLNQVDSDNGVYLEDGSGVFVFARTDGLSVTKPDGKVGLVQSNATARYTLAGLLRPPLWTEDIAPNEYNATATFGTALAITAKGKFIAVVERRYVQNTTQTDDDDSGSPFSIAHFVHVYQRVEGTGKGLTAMYGLKCTLDDPDPLRYASFGYGRHQLAIAQDGKFVTVAIGSQPSTLSGAQADLPNSVYVYRIVAGQTAGKGEDICPFQPEFVVDDPLFLGVDQGSAASSQSNDQPSFFGESVALSADGKVLVVGQPETMVQEEPGSVYLYDLRKPVKKDVYVGNAPLVGVGGYRR